MNRLHWVAVGSGLLVLAAAALVAWSLFWSNNGPALRTIPVVASSVETFGNTLQIDLGKTWFASVDIDTASLAVGTTITVRMGERLAADGRLDPTPFGSVRFLETSLPVNGPNTPVPLTEADSRGMPAGVSVMPVRYIEVAPWPAEVSADAVHVTAYISDRYHDVGSIRFSGDPAVAEPLNRLFELGRHTMAATSFMGLFIDGDRERLPYQADALINQRGWVAITGDTKVARETLNKLLVQPTWPSEWMSQTILLAWEVYEADGDVDYLKSIYDRLRIFTLSGFVDNTGLVSTADKTKADAFVNATGADYLEDIVDWPEIERDGYVLGPHNTVVNAFVFAALERMALIAKAVGRPADAQDYASKADALRQAMLAKLFRPELGTYSDGLESRHVSAHALFFPLAFGLVPDAGIKPTLAAINSRIAAYGGGFPASVYGAQFLLDALFEAGAPRPALQLMLNQTDRGWMHMLDAEGATITHEAWDIAYKPNLDWSHAWGSAFLNVMFRKMVGVQVLQPGWTRWTVVPAQGLGVDIDATLATPRGAVGVKIDAAAGLVTLSGGAALLDFATPKQGPWQYRLITSP